MKSIVSYCCHTFWNHQCLHFHTIQKQPVSYTKWMPLRATFMSHATPSSNIFYIKVLKIRTSKKCRIADALHRGWDGD